MAREECLLIPPARFHVIFGMMGGTAAITRSMIANPQVCRYFKAPVEEEQFHGKQLNIGFMQHHRASES